MDRERRGDITLTSVAGLMALSSLAFAVYMNVANAPTGGINARRAESDAPRVRDRASYDDLTTASIAPLYRLVSVAGGKAYVEEVGRDPRFLLAVTRGSYLAGAGRVSAIENRAGRWVVVTTHATITADVH